MQRALVGSLAAIALASLSSAALAADMVPPEPVASWSGIYLGAGGGIEFGDLNVDSRVCELVYDSCSTYDTHDNDFHDNDSTFVGTSTRQLKALPRSLSQRSQ
jgi:opacity protein-like surface antigen